MLSTTPGPVSLTSLFISIEYQIEADPDKNKCRLSLVKEIKSTTFITLTQNLKLKTDWVSSVIKIYDNIINALTATTNSIVNFPKLKDLIPT